MIAAVLLAALIVTSPHDTSRVLDSFDRIDSWSAHPADGVSLELHPDLGRRGRALRLDFGFTGGGYAIARRALDVPLSGNYAFTFWIKGRAAPNTLEFKLIDRSGENVWWYTERDRHFTGDWEKITVRKRQIAFAWGPKGGGELSEVAAIELVITSGSGGGKGSVWFDDLALTSMPDNGPYTLTPAIAASASRPGHLANAAIDGDSSTSWRAATARPSLTLDFLRRREFGAVSLLWEPGAAPAQVTLLASDDAKRWRVIGSRQRGGERANHFYLPDSDARYLRLDLVAASPARPVGLREWRIESLEAGASRNAFFKLVAGDSPRGSFPRYLSGEASAWTVVGVDGARDEALLGEDGAIEPGTGAFSIEPFLQVGGKLHSWSNVARSASLAMGKLPIPTVKWDLAGASLEITAFARGSATASRVIGRYRVTNRATAPMRGTLYLAIRPFQVNPPWQFLGTPGGTTRIDSLRWDRSQVTVNGLREVRALTPGARFGALPFAGGEIVASLQEQALPTATAVQDPFGAASGALAWPLELAAGASTTIDIEVPFDRGFLPPVRAAGVDTALQQVIRGWERSLDAAGVRLPGAGARIANTIASTLGYILINRDGPALQPGSRSYERSWIRDGALTSTALLRFGHAAEVREFLLWYAGFQYPDGKIPCCVDRRGADPVAEHDSHGEFIYLAMEYFRHTGDRALLTQLWPQVNAAVGYLDSLRRTHRTSEYRNGEQALYHGLLPPSISHEGYSAKAMHSYWDDFFALRGFKDAAAMATALGRPDDARRIGVSRDEFAADLFASIDAVMKTLHIDFIPGAADLGDFDATSTTIALSPVEELPRLPRAAVEHTFERYFTNASARSVAGSAWENYTPYELRTVGAMLRLGWKARALAMLDAFMADQEPTAWNQWPEVVWHDRTAPKFIGDLPHTWVGSDFLRSAADLFVYEREADSALIVAAGIPDAWLVGEGVTVERLSTWWGPLSYTAKRTATTTVVTVPAGLNVPPGGLIVHAPGSSRPVRILLNGAAVQASADGSVTLRALPARIEFTP
ncbi:MAG: discoidin domain-containing protein [Gemmatimonadales bacterium]